MQPIDRGGGTYTLEFGAVRFSVSKVGGRITGFSLGGKEVLMQTTASPSDKKYVYGSTFVLSPQDPKDSALGSCWEPPKKLDTAEYTVDATALAMNKIVLTSPTAKVGYATCPSDSTMTDTGMTSLTVTKTFTPLLDKNAIQVEYTIKNTGTASISWAPWQVSRVAADGLTFFPTSAGQTPIRSQLPLTADAASGFSFWLYNTKDITETYGNKLITDGSGGWLAHATKDKVLFLTRFADTMPDKFAPGDGEIALYASPAADAYVEVEPQGPYAAIPAGMSTTWAITWYIYNLPSDATLTAGNGPLVNFVKGLTP